jgi:hypothetical protein
LDVLGGAAQLYVRWIQSGHRSGAWCYAALGCLSENQQGGKNGTGRGTWLNPCNNGGKVLSKFVQFYRNEVVHPDRLTIEEIMGWDDTQIEGSHNTIQWLFPLTTPSLNVANIQTISADEIEVFRAEPGLQSRVLQSLRRMLRFYGLELQSEGRKIVKTRDFEKKSGWLYPRNHNYKRITRILKSLRILGLETEARLFFAALEEIYSSHYRYIGEETFKHWKKAME